MSSSAKSRQVACRRELEELAASIPTDRPASVVILGQRFDVEYEVDADTGAEYAALEIDLPPDWLVEVGDHPYNHSRFGVLYNLVLPLD